MEQLKIRLTEPDIRGIACSATGELVQFHNRGVRDLFTLVTEHPDFLNGGKLADRVIGRGAALLLLKGMVSEVFAYVISEPALQLLLKNNVKVTYDTLQAHIINRKGDGICPVELLTSATDDPDEALSLISNFITSNT